jgi:uncharacterized protein (DUF3084 family)
VLAKNHTESTAADAKAKDLFSQSVAASDRFFRVYEAVQQAVAVHEKACRETEVMQREYNNRLQEFKVSLEARQAFLGTRETKVVEAEAVLTAREAELVESKSDLDTRKAKLDERESVLTMRENFLAARETRMVERESDLDKRAAEVAATAAKNEKFRCSFEKAVKAFKADIAKNEENIRVFVAGNPRFVSLQMSQLITYGENPQVCALFKAIAAESAGGAGGAGDAGDAGAAGASGAAGSSDNH